MKTEKGQVAVFFVILVIAAIVILYVAYNGVSLLASQGESNNLFKTMLDGLAEVLK